MLNTTVCILHRIASSVKNLNHFFGHNCWVSFSKYRSHLYFIGFNLPQITWQMFGLTTVLWCTYPGAIGSFIVKQVTLKCIFHFNTQSYFYISYSCSERHNSKISILTFCWLGGLGFKRWGGQDFLEPPRPTLRLNQPPVKWIPRLFPGEEVARVWRWPPTYSSADVMYTKSYTSAFPLCLLGM